MGRKKPNIARKTRNAKRVHLRRLKASDIIQRRCINRQRQALRRQLETPEETAIRRAKDRERRARIRKSENPKAREERLKKDRERKAAYRKLPKIEQLFVDNDISSSTGHNWHMPVFTECITSDLPDNGSSANFKYSDNTQKQVDEPTVNQIFIKQEIEESQIEVPFQDDLDPMLNVSVVYLDTAQEQTNEPTMNQITITHEIEESQIEVPYQDNLDPTLKVSEELNTEVPFKNLKRAVYANTTQIQFNEPNVNKIVIKQEVEDFPTESCEDELSIKKKGELNDTIKIKCELDVEC